MGLAEGEADQAAPSSAEGTRVAEDDIADVSSRARRPEAMRALLAEPKEHP